MGPRTGLDGRKISSPPGFDPGLSNPESVAIPTELPGPHFCTYANIQDAPTEVDVQGLECKSLDLTEVAKYRFQ